MFEYVLMDAERVFVLLVSLAHTMNGEVYICLFSQSLACLFSMFALCIHYTGCFLRYIVRYYTWSHRITKLARSSLKLSIINFLDRRWFDGASLDINGPNRSIVRRWFNIELHQFLYYSSIRHIPCRLWLYFVATKCVMYKLFVQFDVITMSFMIVCFDQIHRFWILTCEPMKLNARFR